ncbi:MAG: ATP-binding cassette domain-containing protein [Pirellulaceae bacterium]
MGNAPRLWRLIMAVGASSALLIPMLVVVLGLILHVLVGGPDQGTLQPPSIAAWLITWPMGLFGLITWPMSLFVLVAVSWGLAFAEAVSLFVLQRLVHRYALRIADELRRAIHDQAFLLGPHDLLGPSRSRPEELFADKAEAVRRGLARWWLAIPRSVVALALLLAVALSVHAWLTMLVVLLAVYILRFYRVMRRQLEAQSRTWSGQADERCGALLSSLRLAPLATGYALDELPGESFAEGLEDYEETEFQAQTSQVLLTPLFLFIVLVSISFVLLVVGCNEEITVDKTMLLGASIICAYFPASRLYQLRDRLRDAEAAASEIFAYLDREPAVIQVADAQPIDRIEHRITLDSVTIADRHGHRLLDDVTATIPAGRVVAILASDPQTPLAVAGLFLRFYDPAAGRIFFDDQDISRATLDTVRGQAVLVAADGPVFPGSIAENIACGDSGFTSLQISDAVKQAHADALVQALPDGLNTLIGDRTPSLPENAGFHIGLARALLREPSLLVVQEPTIHLGEEASERLDAALKHAAKVRSLVILPARLATIRASDLVFVFHNGNVDAQGTHADLLQSSELYRHLNYVRFNPFPKSVRLGSDRE